MNKNQHRKLAAILFADIVGYTALMQKNEQKASTIIRIFQQQLEEKVEAHNGQIVNFYGDGALCIFQIPIDAVRCAMALQTEFQNEPKTPIRIGIHSGTVTYESDKIFGDSVNITSRIESMGVAGGILLSKKVRDEVKNNPDLKMQSLGSFEFKNVEEAMEVFALRNDGFVVPKKENIKGKFSEKNKSIYKLLFLPLIFLLGGFFYHYWINATEATKPIAKEKPSIVILPFDNLSNDPTQEYFSDAMADEIRTTISSIDRLKVISRSSSMYFKGKNISQKEIAQKLNVNHVLSGSVLKFENQLKISLELSNTATDEIEWKLNTDTRPLKDIFQLQKEIALEVVKQMRVQLNEQEIANSFKQYTDDPILYDKMLNIYSINYKLLFNQAKEDLTKILQEHPDYVPAMRLLALNYIYAGLGTLPRDSAIKKALPLLLKADELDKTYRAIPSAFGIYKF